MPYRGATLHLDGGRIRISTDSITFPSRFEYGENTEFLKFFVLSYVKLLCDSPLEVSGPKPLRTFIKFYKLLTTDHIKDVIKTFSGYSDTILSSEYSTGGDSSTRVFHEFMKDTPIFKEYLTWLRTGQPELLQYILSFLRFGKKLEYEDPEFHATAFRGWLKVEEKLSALEFDSNDTAALASIISFLLPASLPDDTLLPRFGPGRVSERGIEHVYDKLDRLAWTPHLARVFKSPLKGDYGGFGVRLDAIVQSSNSDRSARLRFVPKDITKSRSICMEPNTYMYFQQEVLRWLVAGFDCAPISAYVNLRDQQNNRDAALHGSKYLCSDTLDLSSASDSVHIDLVRRTFPKAIWRYLLATRSGDVILPNGRDRMVMKKFAPMGSAVCFPVQCILFTAMCIYAYMAVDRGRERLPGSLTKEQVRDFCNHRIFPERSVSTPYGGMYEPPVVYGDDIIVDSRVTDVAISTLQRFGFDVNVSKSFAGSSSFRESCGIYCYEGQDVTPVLFRLPLFRRGKWDAKIFASFIGGVNNLREHGYNNLAAFWLSVLKGYGFKYPLPFTTDPEGFGLFTRNKHRVRPEHLLGIPGWQSMVEIQQGIGPRHLRDEPPGSLDDYRYDQWWRSKTRGSVPLPSERSLLVRPQETRLVPRWTRYEEEN